MEGAVRLQDLRLVHGLVDPETGAKRDVVVKELDIVAPRLGQSGKQRVIAGSSIVIPWPPKYEPRVMENDDDTTMSTIEEKTWIPHLLTAPLPDGVIDELRNPYSTFRERHDDEYIEKKKAEDEKEAFTKDPEKNQMRTPLQELHALRQKEKAAKDPATLTDDMLARIGEVMAANREANGIIKEPKA
jgi:large subunit ribosomal protein L24